MRKYLLKKDRIAIIISAPGENQVQNGEEVDFKLPVHNCVKMLTSYLRTPAAGSWSENEIRHYHEQDFIRNDVQTWYKNLKNTHEYIYVHYIGHGAAEINGSIATDIISLGGTHYPVVDLLLEQSKQTVVIDACRNFYRKATKSMLGDLIDEKSIKGYPHSMKKDFMNIVRKCTEGIVLIQSTQQGRSALGDHNGPFFTQSLINGAYDFLSESTLSKYNSINDSFDLAIYAMRRQFCQTNQNPVIQSLGGGGYPFVLTPPKYTAQFP